MHVTVFHYHLLPGGVTDVIVHSIRALCAHDPSVTSMRIVAGRAEHSEAVLARLADLAVPIGIDVVPEIDYTDPREPLDEALARARAIERRLLADYADDDALWWIHNYHLGKNPSFTRAVCAITELAAAPRMLLHVHDFPECARYENLAYLNRVAGESPYPAAASVRYAVINERDRRLLVAAGVPAERVGLLLNPLPESTIDRPERSGTRDEIRRPDRYDDGGFARERLVSRLAKYAGDQGGHFSPDGPLLLYPVRSIRRKNILEIAAIARLASAVNLVVTLPGVSEPERAYSDLVRFAFEDRRAHGAWGIGTHESEYDLSFAQIAAGADMVVSSSVQEGFGLLFVNALRWRKPLLARRLGVLEGIDALFEGYPADFYDSFLVPTRTPSVTTMRAYLSMRYGERLADVGELVPRVARDRLELELEELLSAESIDFSYLPAQMQLTVLGDLSDRGFGAYVRAMNADIVSRVETLPTALPPGRDRELDALLGYTAFASRFAELVGGAAEGAGLVGAAGGSRGRHESVQGALVDAFARIGRLRLLLGPIDHHENGG